MTTRIEELARVNTPGWKTIPHQQRLLRDIRSAMRENQTEFWRRFGVSQSRGSRFEQGMVIPAPVLILMRLYFCQRITDLDLAQAMPQEDTLVSEDDEVMVA